MNDLISRQAAIDEINEMLQDTSQHDDPDISEIEAEAYDEGVRNVGAMILALPSAQSEPQWIPCSERLPDKTDDYLCSYSGCAVADICEYDPDRNEWGFFYDGGWKVVSNVIAWLPLPEPYKEKDNERA